MSTVTNARYYFCDISNVEFDADTDLTAAHFAGVTWVEIEQPEFIDRLPQAREQLFHMGNRGFSRQFATATGFLAGDTRPRFISQPDSPGQAELWRIWGLKETFTQILGFRIVMADGSERIFAGNLYGMNEFFGAAGDLAELELQVTINSKIVRVAPPEA